MITDKKCLQFVPFSEDFCCKPEERVKDILAKFENTDGRPLIVISNNRTLYGIISTGDIRHSLSDSIDKFEKTLVKNVCNKNPLNVKVNESNTVIERLLSENIRVIPLLDKDRKVVGCGFNDNPSLKIGQRKISSDNHYIYLIAEIGVNHNGSKDEALFLIDQAKSAGFDAVKLQIRSNKTYSSDSFDKKDLSVQYIEKEINRTKIELDIYRELIENINQSEIDIICTPFDEDSLEFIMSIGVDAIKIASCDLTNEPLIKKAMNTNKPIIVSTGMSTENEIIKTSNLMKRYGNHAFLHCNSTYPSPPENINLEYIRRLHGLTNCVTGYSSHDGNTYIPYASIGFGARIIECHITRDKKQSGTDHLASIETKEINKFVKSIRTISESIGDDLPRVPSQGELMNKISLGKSLCYSRELEVGEILRDEDLCLRSPASGVQYSERKEFIGKKLGEKVNTGETLTREHFSMSQKEYFKFEKINCTNLIPGIPVRYHDINKLNCLFDLPFYEFHMSSNDILLSPENYIHKNNYREKKLLVHSVEQYEDGFIIDLGSDDENIVKESISRIEDSIKHISRLRLLFSPQDKVPLIINCGGHSQGEALDDSLAKIKVRKIAEKMRWLQEEYSEINFLAQTMPPFPWHQGGRSFHNCLAKRSSIYTYIKESGMDLCVDLSHTALAANYFNFNFYETIRELIPHTYHIHVGDASRNNQEGLQLGMGDLDFHKILELYINSRKSITFIPEIWQGHLNQGEGFSKALRIIEETISEIISQ